MSRRAPAPLVEVVCGAIALLGALALARLVGGGWRAATLGPLTLTAFAGYATCAAAARRAGGTNGFSVALGVVAVALVALWTVLARATDVGLPTARTWRRLRSDLVAARPTLHAFHLPLRVQPGTVLLAALLAGLVAVAGRSLLGPDRRRQILRPAVALLPCLGLVVWSLAAVGGTGAVTLALATAAAALFLLGLADRPPRPVPPDQADGRGRPRTGPGAVLVGGLAVGLAAAVGLPLAAAAGTAGGGNGVGTATSATGLALVSDPVGVERRDPDLVLFRATTPVPTYWQLGLLDLDQGGRFVPGPDELTALHGAGAGASATVGPVLAGQTFTARVTVAGLSSRLLPVPLDTESVAGPVDTVMTGLGALSSEVSAPGDRYQAVAIVPRAVDPASAGGPSGLSPAAEAPDLVLPPLPSAVEQLARQLTALASTPLGKAELLVDYLRSDQFRYTLDVTRPPAGTDPLVDFLTHTHTGDCEDFAGAFAVLARAVGLPTRLVVGFTAGQRVGDGTYVVTGADAHAWPEVYLDARLGWVSFEPTPEQPSGSQVPDGVVGPTGISSGSREPRPVTPSSLGATPTLPPTSTPSTSPPTTAASPTTARGAAPTVAPPAPGGGSAPLVVTLLLVAALGLLAGALFRLRRRRRRRPGPPARRVAAAWATAERALGRAGVSRPPGRTPRDHARALRAAAERRAALSGGPRPGDDALVAALADVERLAAWAEEAAYGPDEVPGHQARSAEASAARVERALRGDGRRRLGSLAPAVEDGAFIGAGREG